MALVHFLTKTSLERKQRKIMKNAFSILVLDFQPESIFGWARCRLQNHSTLLYTDQKGKGKNPKGSWLFPHPSDPSLTLLSTPMIPHTTTLFRLFCRPLSYSESSLDSFSSDLVISTTDSLQPYSDFSLDPLMHYITLLTIPSTPLIHYITLLTFPSTL